MKKKFQFLIAALVALGVTGIGTAHPTYAAGDVVTTCSGNPGMAGSLPYEVANAVASDTITFDVSCPSASPITLSAPVTISRALTIDGTGASVVIDGGNTTRLFIMNAPNNGLLMPVTFTDLTFEHGKGTSGGAIQNSEFGYVSVINSTFMDNSVSGSGGAISNLGEWGTVNAVGSTFAGNSAMDGGAIYSTTVYGAAYVTGSTFSGNKATGDGGAVYNGVSNLTVRGNSSGDSSFSGNSASSGGAIYNLGDVTIQSGSTLSSNSAPTGGAIYNGLDGYTSISGSTLSGNSASCGSFSCSANGGAIDSYEGLVTITGSTLSGNSATCSGTFCSGSGGAIYNNLGPTSIDTSTLADNSASCGGNFGCHGNGGAVFSVGVTTITNSTLAGNAAPHGGAIYNGDRASMSGSIVASASGGNCANFSVSDNGYNLEWTGSTTAGYTCGFSSASHDIVGRDPKFVTDSSGTPLLASNGGPTQTVALQSTSPAADYIPVGQPGCSVSGGIDQRGINRPDDGEASCSIGAYEYDGPDQQAQTINWPAPSQTTYTYGDGLFRVSAAASSGLSVSFSIDSGSSSVCSAAGAYGATITILSAGTCKVLADQSGNAGYSAAPEVSQSFTINKAPLSVAANDKTMTYGGTVPTFDATVSALVNGDTFASLAGSCSAAVNGNAVSASTPAGTYPGAITCSGVDSGNYMVSYTAGTLGVNPAKSTATVGTSGSPTMQGQSVTLTATVSPQYTGTPSGSVTFYDGTTALGSATLTNGQARLSTSALTIGSHTITVSYGGDVNFTGSTSSALTQNVDTNLSTFPTMSNGAYNLGSVNLAGAYLVGANLAGAVITSANLSGANLTGANVTGATLTSANLSGANLSGATLRGANLSSANFTNATFSTADLTNANLTKTNLKRATGLTTATLSGVIWSQTTCPDNTSSNQDGDSCAGHL